MIAMHMYMYVYVCIYTSYHENRFCQYRQMSGGRFILVNLCEVKTSERILACRSLLLEHVNFWMEDLFPDVLHISLDEFAKFIEANDSRIYQANLTNDSEEVASWLCWKNIVREAKCNTCKSSLTATTDTFDNKYVNMLSRGNLTISSPSLAEFVSNGFAILDSVDDKINTFNLLLHELLQNTA